MSDGTDENAEFRFQAVGEQLKAARESAGFSLEQIAQKTRVPMRHLEAIEKSNFGALPGPTYTMGFVKAYSRALNLDEPKIISELRVELSQGGFDGKPASQLSYEPTDPARVPSRTLAWTAAGIALALLVGYFVWRSFAFAPDATPVADTQTAEKKADQPAPVAANTPAAAIDPKGQVVLTATDTVWLRVYDANKKRLFESEMKAGESYTIPADAANPMVNTGRAQAIKVTIGGKEVAPLGPPDKGLSDVGVSAQALLARVAEPASPATTATPQTQNPAPTATTTPATTAAQ